MKVLAIIPARGGSKRIRHKNTKELWGRPLISYTIEASRGCACIDATVVSTDDSRIAEVAHNCGAEVIARPAALATDDAKTEPVLLQVVEELENRGRSYDVIILLQATSPLRKTADIASAFAQFVREGADSLVSVTEEYRLYWRDGAPLNYSLESYLARPRLCKEDMTPFLKENGAIYIFKTSLLKAKNNRLGGKVSIFRMAAETEIELDTRGDWLRLQKARPRGTIGGGGVYVIAEIGCNHQGDVDVAKRMIEVAKYCEVDAVKFQKRDLCTYLSREQYNKPYDNPHSFGKTYGEHREFLELSLDEHAELMEHAQSLGLACFSSVWDAASARQMAGLGCEMVKIPSACITDAELLKAVNRPGMPVLASVGMSTIEEVDTLVQSLDRVKDLYLLQCTSTYPCNFENINLSVIPALKQRYGDRVKGIGFSGHHLGISVDVAAVAMGATVIERHFTLDRTMKGTDHAASLEPEGMRRLVRDIRAFEKARGDGRKERLACEIPSWEKLRKVKSETPGAAVVEPAGRN